MCLIKVSPIHTVICTRTQYVSKKYLYVQSPCRGRVSDNLDLCLFFTLCKYVSCYLAMYSLCKPKFGLCFIFMREKNRQLPIQALNPTCKDDMRKEKGGRTTYKAPGQVCKSLEFMLNRAVHSLPSCLGLTEPSMNCPAVRA